MNDRSSPKDPKTPVQVISVTGGKGGVGKTNVAINLAIALSLKNKKVMLFDADLGLANVNVLLGINTSKNISHVLSGENTLQEILLDGPLGIKIIPAASGISKMTELNANEQAGLISAFSTIETPVDTLIIDTAAGISDSVRNFSSASQEIIVVVCNEPSSIADAYALIKVMNKSAGIKNFRILANMIRDDKEGQGVFKRLSHITDKFLDVNLLYIGAIPFDEHLRNSVKQQKALMELFPGSKSAKGFIKLADEVSNWPTSTEIGGRISFFIERLVDLNKNFISQESMV